MKKSPKKSIQEQVQHDSPEFASEVVGLSVEELDARLAQLAKDTEAFHQARESDDALEEARHAASELAAPYRDGAKALRLKSRYLVALIKEKGGK